MNHAILDAELGVDVHAKMRKVLLQSAMEPVPIALQQCDEDECERQMDAALDLSRPDRLDVE